MTGSVQPDVWTNQGVIANGDGGGIQHYTVVVDEYVLPDGDILSQVAPERLLNHAVLSPSA